MTTTAADDWRELANREADGLVVSLLWSKSTNHVKVAVVDARLDQDFELRVGGADALAVFDHPFAYAPHTPSGSERSWE